MTQWVLNFLKNFSQILWGLRKQSRNPPDLPTPTPTPSETFYPTPPVNSNSIPRELTQRVQ